MQKAVGARKGKAEIGVMDALLYVLAGSSMVIISLSFLLWLRF